MTGITIPDMGTVLETIAEQMALAATVEEVGGPSAKTLVAGTLVAADRIGSGNSARLIVFTALQPVRLVQLALTHNNASNIAANDTNYWNAVVYRWSGSTSNAIVSKTSRVSGGEGWARRTGWTFDNAAFDPTYSAIPAGSCVGIELYTTGTATDLAEVGVTWRTEPIR